MAYFDKAVPPGGEGKITLQVKTSGYQGVVHKSARVYTNDPARNIQKIILKATVRVPISLSARHVFLFGPNNKRISKAVQIKAELERPLVLTPEEFTLEDKVAFSINEMEQGRRFEIVFTTIPGPPQTYQGVLKIKTNYPERPEISILIRGRTLGTS